MINTYLPTNVIHFLWISLLLWHILYCSTNSRRNKKKWKKSIFLHSMKKSAKKLPFFKMCERSELVNISQLFFSFSQTRHLPVGLSHQSSKTKVELKNLKNGLSISSKKSGQKLSYFGQNPTLWDRKGKYKIANLYGERHFQLTFGLGSRRHFKVVKFFFCWEKYFMVLHSKHIE